MQIKENYTQFKHLDFLIVDILSLLICFVISFRLKFGDFRFIRDSEWHLYILIIVLLNIAITFFTNPYDGIFKRSYYQEVIRALTLAVYNLLVAAVFFYLLKMGAAFSREMTVWMYSLYFVLSLIMKYAWKKIRLSRNTVFSSVQTIPLFIIGSSENIDNTLNNVNSGDYSPYLIKGIHFVDKNAEIDGIPTVSDDYVDYILENNIEEVLVAVNPSLVPESVYERLSVNGVELNLAIEESVGFLSEDQSVQQIGVYPVLSIKRFSFTQNQMLYLKIKRVLDVIAALLVLLILAPIALIVKISYLASGDKSKIIYTQKRVGKSGRLFKMYKFRTMVPNADEKLKELLKQDEYRKQWEENQKIVNDPRITKVGRILRKTSIDEISPNTMFNMVFGLVCHLSILKQIGSAVT